MEKNMYALLKRRGAPGAFLYFGVDGLGFLLDMRLLIPLMEGTRIMIVSQNSAYCRGCFAVEILYENAVEC